MQEIEIHGKTSSEFIEIEREYFETVETTHLSNGKSTSNGYTQEVSTQKTTIMSEETQKPKPDILEDLYETIGDENIYENVENTTTQVEVDSTDAASKKPNLTLPTTFLTASESLDLDGADQKSVKDRMFLSSDDTSCLLFTQTVTSPMLTPSEENIDFLKGFRRQSNNGSDSSSSSTATKPDENATADKPVKNIETEENIYENVTPNAHVNIYENVQDLSKDDHKTDSQKFIENEALYANVTEVNVEPQAPKASHSEIESFDDDDSQREIEKNQEICQDERVELVETSSDANQTSTDVHQCSADANHSDVIEDESVDANQCTSETESYECTQEKQEANENVSNVEDEANQCASVTKDEEYVNEMNDVNDDLNKSIEETNQFIQYEKEACELIQDELQETAVTNQPSPVANQLSTVENHSTFDDFVENFEVVSNENICDEQKVEHLQNNTSNKTDEQKSNGELSYENLENPTPEKVDDTKVNGCSKKPYSFEIKEKTKKFEEIAHKTDELPVVTGNKMLISPTQNIQNLKSVFMKTESDAMVTSTEKLEFSELKTLDIMKQIHKFENISPSKDSSDDVNTVSYCFIFKITFKKF